MLALQPTCILCENRGVVLKQTKLFRVLDLHDDNDREVNAYKIEGYDTSKDARFLKNMRLHGLTTWGGLVPEDMRLKALKVLRPFIRKMIQAYDPLDDEFCGIDQEEMNIVRMPRIGRGKHNIHFDPQFSEQHQALAELAAESHFAELLTSYMRASCSIRESGISMTRPYDNSIQHRVQPVVAYRKPVDTPPACSDAVDPNGIASEEQPAEHSEEMDEEPVDLAAGEGMEWHSDGPRGEATILMALEDVSPDQGCLRVIPNSHKIYVDGIGHTEVCNLLSSRSYGLLSVVLPVAQLSIQYYDDFVIP
jgi:hypothetical protein